MNWTSVVDHARSTIAWLAKPAAVAALVVVAAILVVVVSALLRGPVTSRLIAAGQPAGEGVQYSLPKTEIIVSATLRIKNCRLVGKKVVLDTSQDVVLQTVVVPDPEYRYVLEAGTLQHPVLSDAWSFELTEDGLLSGIGYSPASLDEEAKALEATIDGLIAAAQPGAISDTPDPLVEAEACRGLPTDAKPTPAGTSPVTVAIGTPAEASAPVAPEVILTAHQLVDKEFADITITPGEQFTTGYSDGVIEALKKARVHIHFGPQEMASGAPTPTARGIVYRQPSTIAVFVCRDTCLNDSEVFARSRALSVENLRVFRPGNEAALPLERGWFGERNAAVSFTTEGGIASVALNRDPVDVEETADQ